MKPIFTQHCKLCLNSAAFYILLSIGYVYTRVCTRLRFSAAVVTTSTVFLTFKTLHTEKFRAYPVDSSTLLFFFLSLCSAYLIIQNVKASEMCANN